MSDAMIYMVIPCCDDKIDTDVPVPARDLYAASANWRNTLRKVEAEAAMTDAPVTVLILSALYGLITTDQIIAPYNLRMGAPGSVTTDTLAEQCRERGMAYDEATEGYPEIYMFLPRDYRTPLDQVLRADDVFAFDVFEAAPGIGYQRGVISHLAHQFPDTEGWGQPDGMLGTTEAQYTQTTR